jgi:hypothetical protein
MNMNILDQIDLRANADPRTTIQLPSRRVLGDGGSDAR